MRTRTAATAWGLLADLDVVLRGLEAAGVTPALLPVMHDGDRRFAVEPDEEGAVPEGRIDGLVLGAEPSG